MLFLRPTTFPFHVHLVWSSASTSSRMHLMAYICLETDNLSNPYPVPPNALRDEILPQGRPSLLIFVSRINKANRQTQNTSKCIHRYTCQDAIVCGCRNACYEYCVPSTVFSLSLSLSLSLSVSFSFSISLYLYVHLILTLTFPCHSTNLLDSYVYSTC